MEQFENLINRLSGYVWGGIPVGEQVIPVLTPLLLGVGVYLMLGMGFVPWRKIGNSAKVMWRGRSKQGEGDITPFQALSTALAATIGTGNIAGVATAIALGGPGAVFWMWVTALFGMATKYAEAVLAVNYREVDERGKIQGGPMYYIKNGMGESWKWLGALFALFGMIAAFGIGNMVQANSVADAVHASFDVNEGISGTVMAILAGAVIIGGITRIADVASKLVPFMAVAYVVMALIVISINLSEVPAALAMIVADAFTGTAATGGFAGAAVWAAFRFGIARGVFSNEAGLGSAPIAHAAAQTNEPVRQGMIGSMETFIDTIIVCTMTALVIILTGAWTSGENGAPLTAMAFATALPDVGQYIVTIGLILFAFTTVLGWSYYGERCAEYLFGVKVILPYRILWLVAIVIGALGQLGFIWALADLLNGLMALPNLIALAALSPIVFKLTREYFAKNTP